MSACTYCGRDVDHTGYRKVTGWERKAKAASRKGGSDIVLREALAEFACASCITRLKLGMSVHQESLV